MFFQQTAALLSAGKVFFQPNRWHTGHRSSLCNWVPLVRLHVVVFGGLAYQQNEQDRPSSRKGTVAAQSAFIGRSAYSRKNTSADSSACASLTCESRAYSVIFQQKGSAQQGKAVYLTAFRINYAPPAKVLLLFSLRRLPMGSKASQHWRSIFESTTLHVAESLNVWTLDLISLKLAGELFCYGIRRIKTWI